MFGRRSKKRDDRSAGLRVTEGLLPIFGPAQVGDSTAPLRPVTAAEHNREALLRSTLTKVVGPDGRSYVVSSVAETAPSPATQPTQPQVSAD